MGSRTQIVLDEVSRWGVMIAFILLPFLFLPVPWFSIAQSKAAMFAILLSFFAVTWLLARLLEGQVRFPGLLPLGAVALLPVAYLLSAAVSGFTPVSLFGTGVDPDTFASAALWFGAFALIALTLSGKGQGVVPLLRAFLSGVFVLEIIQVVHLAAPQISFGGAIAGIAGNALGSWHDFAILASVATFLGVALYRSPVAAGFWKYIVGAVAALSVLLLVVANFRDVWIGLGLVSLAHFVYLRMSHLSVQREQLTYAENAPNTAPASQSKIIYRLFMALIAVSLFFAVFGTYIANVMPEPVRVAAVEVRPSWQGTLQISEQSLTDIKSLFFGSGPNTFINEWGLYKPAEINATPFWNTEFTSGIGTVVTSFVTVGIAGLLAWLAVLGLVLFLAFATLRRARAAQDGIPEAVALSTILLFAYYVMYVPGPAISMASFLFLGLLLALAARIGIVQMRSLSLRTDGVVIVAARTLAVLVFAIAIGYAAYGTSRVLASEAVLNRGILEYNTSGNIEGSSSLVARAIQIAPENDRAQRAAVQLGLLQLQQLIAKADPNDEAARTQLQSTLETTIQHGLNAVSINSGSYQNWLELASLYQQLAGANVEGAYENARGAYAKALEGNPRNPLPILQLAQLELLQNRPADALQLLASAIQLKNDFAPAYYLASQIYAAQNDFQNGAQAAANAVQYAQNDPLAWYNLGIILYAGGDYPNAEAALQQAITRQPQYANAYYMLGLSLYQQKKADAALQAFVELEKLSPDQPIVKEILTNLRAGKPPLRLQPPQSQTQQQQQRRR